jgi:hypothetical protein
MYTIVKQQPTAVSRSAIEEVSPCWTYEHQELALCHLRQPAQSVPNVCLYLFDKHFCLSVILCSLHSRLSHGIKPKAPASQ